MLSEYTTRRPSSWKPQCPHRIPLTLRAWRWIPRVLHRQMAQLIHHRFRLSMSSVRLLQLSRSRSFPKVSPLLFSVILLFRITTPFSVPCCDIETPPIISMYLSMDKGLSNKWECNICLEELDPLLAKHPCRCSYFRTHRSCLPKSVYECQRCNQYYGGFLEDDEEALKCLSSTSRLRRCKKTRKPEDLFCSVHERLRSNGRPVIIHLAGLAG